MLLLYQSYLRLNVANGAGAAFLTSVQLLPDFDLIRKLKQQVK
jgi:hypothetical protein